MGDKHIVNYISCSIILFKESDLCKWATLTLFLHVCQWCRLENAESLKNILRGHHGYHFDTFIHIYRKLGAGIV